MLTISNIGGSEPKASPAKRRLAELNLSIASIGVRQQALRKKTQQRLSQAQADLNAARAEPLVNIKPMLQPLANLVQQLANVDVANPLRITPNTLSLVLEDIEPQIDRLRVLVQGAPANGILRERANLRGEINQFLSRRAGLDIQFTGYLYDLSQAINGWDYDAFVAALNVGLSGRNLDAVEQAFVNRLRDLTRVAFAIKSLNDVTPVNNASLSLFRWYQDPNSFDDQLALVNEIQREIAELTATLTAIPNNPRDGETLANLEKIRTKLQEQVMSPSPTEVKTIQVNVGDPIDLRFYVESAGQISIKIDLLDGPWAEQFRAEAPDGLAIKDLQDQLKNTQDQFAKLESDIVVATAAAARNQRPVPTPDILQSGLQQATERRENVAGFAANAAIIGPPLAAPGAAWLVTARDVEAAYVAAIVDPTDQALLQAVDDAILADLQAELAYKQAAVDPALLRQQLSALTQARDAQPVPGETTWRTHNRLASTQADRDITHSFKVYVNDNYQTLAFTGQDTVVVDGPAAPAAGAPPAGAPPLLPPPGFKGYVSIRANAKAYHTGPIQITVTSKVWTAGPPPTRETVDQVFLNAHLRVMELCPRSGELACALDQEEFGMCKFTLNLTSWERNRLLQGDLPLGGPLGAPGGPIGPDNPQGLVLRPGIRGVDELRQQVACFRGWHFASDLLIRPPLNSRARPDEWTLGDYSSIEGNQRDGFTASDLRHFQLQQAQGLGAPEDVELPMTPNKARLFATGDSTIQAYIAAANSNNNWLAQIQDLVVTGLGSSEIVVPDPLGGLPLVIPVPRVPRRIAVPDPTPLAPIRSKATRVEVEVDDDSEYYSDDDPPTPTEANTPDGGFIIPETPEDVIPASPPPRPDIVIPETPSPAPSRSGPDRSILKGKTEVYESEIIIPEPAMDPERRKLEREFQKAMTIKIIDPPRNKDGSLVLNEKYHEWIHIMHRFTHHNAALETQLRN